MGGTLALYAQRGVEVHLVCATRGEAGDVAPELLEGFASVADRRMSELSCAAAVLGLSGVHFLDYRDSGMPGSPDNHHPRALAAAPLDDVSACITRYMRLLRPQVVLTFDPLGGYKHPDHIAIHRATTRAFHLAGQASFADDLATYQPQKLYYQVFPKKALRLAVRVLPLFGRDPRRFGRNKDVDLAALVEEGDFPVHAEIDYRGVEDRHTAAATCHASQLGGSGIPLRGPLAWLWRRFGSKEQYMRGYPPAEYWLREKDLFEGLLLPE